VERYAGGDEDVAAEVDGDRFGGGAAATAGAGFGVFGAPGV
jgi:hypothetical protein